MLPLSTELLREEIKGARAILSRWEERLGEGVPLVDRPGSEEAMENFVRELCGELLVCAGKCETLVGLFE